MAYRGRNVGIDLAKALAAFGVVVLHFIGPQAGAFNAALYLLAAFAIPVFIMCNGWFVLNKDSITWRYSVGKAAGLIMLCALWCVVNWAIFAVVRHDLGVWGVLTPVHDFLACALQRGDDGILWYLWMLAGLELAAPIVAAIRKTVGWGPLVVTLGVLCLCIDVASAAAGATDRPSVQSVVPQPLRAWTWLFYFCLGGMLGGLSMRSGVGRGVVRPALMFIAGAGGGAHLGPWRQMVPLGYGQGRISL